MPISNARRFADCVALGQVLRKPRLPLTPLAVNSQSNHSEM
jgi:hypothetical protein